VKDGGTKLPSLELDLAWWRQVSTNHGFMVGFNQHIGLLGLLQFARNLITVLSLNCSILDFLESVEPPGVNNH